MLINNLLLSLGVASSVYAAAWIVPGAIWYDTDGNKIDAHGGSIMKRGSIFYWVGQSNSNNVTAALYSSTDLLNWDYLGLQSSVGQMWRPKLAKPNGSFWIYGQVNKYVQALKSTTMVGGYKAYGAPATLPPSAKTFSDEGIFLDVGKSGAWYLLTSASSNVVQINLINSDGSIGERVNRLAAGEWEAPGLIQDGGIYYLILSDKTGYRSNPNKVFYATGLTGTWTGPFDIAPPETNTYNSQNTFELPIFGSQKTTWIYMGDQWTRTGDVDSNYVWLPIIINPSLKTVTLDYYDMWKIDVRTGVVSTPTVAKRYEAEDAIISGRAAIANCDHCISKRSVHKIRFDSEVTFHNVTGTGAPQWISFHYKVNDAKAGEAYITINNHSQIIKLSDLNSGAGCRDKVPVELKLKQGDTNTIKFGAHGSSGFEVVLDGIEIYEEI